MALHATAQNQDKLVQKLAGQLCDSMSSKLASIDDVEKYFIVIVQSDSTFFKKMVQSPDFEALARSISSDVNTKGNPYAEAVERIIYYQQANCPFFEKYWSLSSPIKQSIQLVGDSTCRCMENSISEREKSFAIPETYLKYFQNCAVGAAKHINYAWKARLEFDLVKQPKVFDKQLVAYIFTKCTPMVKAFALGRASGLSSIRVSDLWLKTSKTIMHNALNNKLNDTLDKYFVTKKAFKKSYDELIRGRKILPEECGYSEKILKTKDSFAELFTFSSWKINKVLGQFRIEYDKDAFGKIKSIQFIEPKDIKNLNDLNAELAKYPPPPPPPMLPPPPPTGKN